MMKSISRDQAHALAALVTALRPDWDTPGVLKALSDARDRGTAHDVAHAALYAAADPKVRTPAVIAMAGEHWTRGKTLGATTSITAARCEQPDHEHELAHNCRICRSTALERATPSTHQDERTPPVPTEQLPPAIRQVLATARGEVA